MLSAYSEWGRIRKLSKGVSLRDLMGLKGAMFIDSGGLQGAAIRRMRDPIDVLESQRALGADIASSLDDPTIWLTDHRSNEALRRHRRSVENALHAFQAKPTGLRLFASVNARDPGLVAQTIRFLERQADFDGYALGGLAFKPGRLTLVVDSVVEARREAGGKPVHLFGIGGLSTLALLYFCGADSFDSSSPMLCGANRLPFSEDGGALRSNRARSSTWLPCVCPVCAFTKATDVMDSRDLMIMHNLWNVALEVRKIKKAHLSGNLHELIERRVLHSEKTRSLWKHALARIRRGF